MGIRLVPTHRVVFRIKRKSKECFFWCEILHKYLLNAAAMITDYQVKNLLLTEQ